VATVSATGVVTFVAAGSTTITATKTADASYLSASANYSLTITSAATGSASFTAWLGEDDARVSFPSPPAESTFCALRSSTAYSRTFRPAPTARVRRSARRRSSIRLRR
jgi:hypothetical protein